MLKKIILAATSAASLLFVANANANANEISPYISGKLQYVFNGEADFKNASKVDLDRDLGFGLAAGATINNNYRAELEVFLQDSDLDDNYKGSKVTGSSEGLFFMANGFYDFKNSSQFTPYLGAGLGFAKLDIEEKIAGKKLVDDSDTVFAYQALVGVSYDINKNNSVSLGYRYVETADADLKKVGGGKTEAGINSHAIEVGYRFNF